MLQIARALQGLGAHVHVLSLNPRKQRGDATLVPLPIDAVDIDTSAHFAALLRSYRIGAPQLIARFYSPQFASKLRALLAKGRFDIVQVESPFLLPYVPVIRETRALIVLRSLNVEFRLWEQLAAQEKNPARRIAFRVLARSLRRYEVAHLNTCDALVPITNEDAHDFRALGCTIPIHVLPGGVDLDRVDRSSERANSVGFLGSLDYRPNQEAALWIANELQPRVPSAEFHIGGSNPPAALREQLGSHLEADVPDAAAFIRSMRIMIAPIFSGGGMRIKILDAMAHGKAVVATSAGASGLDVRHGANILIADDAEAFAAAVTGLLADPSRALAIGDAGRRLVEVSYTTSALAGNLHRFYEKLMERRGINIGG